MNLELITKLETQEHSFINPGITRVVQILNKLGNPQNNYKVIHITGTNGKGSTAAFIEAGLHHAGFKVGKFTSPYIHLLNETIRINLAEISDNELNKCELVVLSVMKDSGIELSPFELLTAIMFYYFAQNNIDYLVLEVGMGGKNDATNVVDSIFSIITNIALEHTSWLGSTLAEIAEEKSGIIKNGKTIIADYSSELLEAVKKRTTNYVNVIEKYNPIIKLDTKNFKTILKFRGEEYSLSLFGKFQAYNFLCAYEVLGDLGIAKDSIKYMAENTKWAYRLEVIEKEPLLIFDATHNEHGAKHLHETLQGLIDSKDVVIITSILVDKNISGMFSYFSKIANTVVYTSIANNSRGMNAQELAKIGNGMFLHENIKENPKEALEFSRSLNKKMIIVAGSLFLLNYYKPANTE
ncbi:MAG TPA: Mur ligase family protein [Burkholderiales bacterium]|nr:Mur ligase family protein [Burkholderiales bacterium]